MAPKKTTTQSSTSSEQPASTPVVAASVPSETVKAKKTKKAEQPAPAPAPAPVAVAVESSVVAASVPSETVKAKKTKKVEKPAPESSVSAPVSEETSVSVEKPKRVSKKKQTEESHSTETQSSESSSESSSETSSESASSEKRVRKVVNQDTLKTDVEQLKQQVEDEIQHLRTSEQRNKGVKFLKVVNKSLKCLSNDLKRVLKTKNKSVRSKNTSSGFMKPVRISNEMAQFTSWDQSQLYSRNVVTKFICDYVRDNNLQNPEDRRQILCDEKLASLLKFDIQNSSSPLTYPGIQKYMQHHFFSDVSSVAEEVVQP